MHLNFSRQPRGPGPEPGITQVLQGTRSSSLKGFKSTVENFAGLPLRLVPALAPRRQSHAWDRVSSQLRLLLTARLWSFFLFAYLELSSTPNWDCSFSDGAPIPRCWPAMGPKRTARLCSRTPSCDTAGVQWCPGTLRAFRSGLPMLEDAKGPTA